MKTIRRNKEGEVTHIRVGTKFYTKEDANKIDFADVDVRKFLKNNIRNSGIEELFELLVNEKISIEQMRINILLANGEIGLGEN